VEVEARLAGRRVLIVEDEAMIAALIETLLNDAGCSVLPVASAQRALEAIEQEGFDAVVLDISVRDGRSYLLADALIARGVPFVFVSGFAPKDMPADYRSCAYVAKPFKPDALLAVLDKVVGAH
jgi:CheY-like chemotaxis protein